MKCDKDCLSCQLPDCIYTKYSGTPEEKEYRREYMRAWRQRNPEKYEKTKAAMRAVNRKRYYDLKAQGICTYCGKRKAVNGIRCPECAKLNNEYGRRYRAMKKGQTA